MYQNNPVNTLPTMYDLPSEDSEEMGLPSAEGVSLEASSSACTARDEFHDTQPDLLKETCRPAANDFFMGADLNLYYDVEHTGWYKRPDYFLAIFWKKLMSVVPRFRMFVSIVSARKLKLVH